MNVDEPIKDVNSNIKPNQNISNIDTDDSGLPVYYSTNAIYYFSIFLSVICGAILLALNIRENKSGKWFVIGFGAVFTITGVTIINYLGGHLMLILIVNAFGSSLLTGFFWNKYIGKSVQYKPKSIKKPLMVSLPFILVWLYLLYLTS